ncbi:helix-turn-helix transcriptional regulator [bacterium]|nr:helix-turn-helix transcriptional regulator [bacterium]MBU1064542.1 helix-turn-helix transcriptional regulator [bacterium]MBU1633420.1 helix-turn-helix transcriptional regulator [bacterium]MBU1873350.1 helix-turn-helix transcriptional regulator [bacterium]
MELKNNLKRYRFDNNQLTQEKMAEALDVSRQTIIAIESGKFNPSVKLALKMANLFQCRIEDLFYMEEK